MLPAIFMSKFDVQMGGIGTEHQSIYLHNAWPDTAVDAQLSLTERLKGRIQEFHDMIGLDTPLLSEDERLNPGSMYAIYSEQRLPGEEEDPLDDVAAYQRGVNLLQQLERDNPDLWALVTTLPDGIRSARVTPPPAAPSAEDRFATAVALPPLQMPLLEGPMQTGLTVPMDAPGRDETIVLLAHEGASLCYAADSAFSVRRITQTQLIAAVACDPDTPAASLPRDTNQRVTAAYQQARLDLQSRLGKARKSLADTKLRRYLKRRFRSLREHHKGNDEELRRIGVLERIFPDEAPPKVAEALEEMRRPGIEGDGLIRRLEALRALYRLNPPGNEDGAGPAEVGVLRIVCSEGLE